MVNFRYHLVSLTAVFLALAIGITIGVTVVDQGLVDRLQDQLTKVRESVGETNQQNEQAKRQLSQWNDFASKAGPALLAGRLQGAPVVLVAVRGVDTAVVKAVRSDLADADAQVQGTVWLTGRLKLDKVEDVRELGEILGSPTVDVDALRTAALDRLGAELGTTAAAPASSTTVIPTTTAPTTPASPSSQAGVTTSSPTAAPATTTTATAAPAARLTLLAGLVEAGFADVDGPETGTFEYARLPAGTRFVVVSAAETDLVAPDAIVPLVRALLGDDTRPVRVVVAEPGRPPQGETPEQRGVVTGVIRSLGRAIDTRVSTVNNIEDFRGRAAVALALADLADGRTGHYGVGSGADRPVPEIGG